MNDIVITFDVDWAPDDILEEVFEYLCQNNIKSTWFITHSFPLLQELKKSKLIELGIHPNFLPGSTQGNSDTEVINFMKALLPDTTLLRTHGVYQSGPLLSKMVKDAGIEIDSSIFLPEHNNITPIKHLTPYGTLVRVPIFWADDYEMLKSSTDWDPIKYFSYPGLKVFLFHPIHIRLNTRNMLDYQRYKESGTIQIGKDKSQSKGGIGVQFFFKNLISEIKSRSLKTNFIKEVI